MPEIRYVVARSEGEARAWFHHTAYSWRECERSKALAFLAFRLDEGWALYRVSSDAQKVSGK